MSAVTSTLPSPPATRRPGATPQPAFLGTLRALWLFIWKSQLTWRRMPLLLTGLLVLPAFISLVVSQPKIRARDSLWSGDNPAREVNNFRMAVATIGIQLTAEQRAGLRRIFEEEYAAADRAWMKSPSADPGIEEPIKRIQACYQRIHDRAAAILNDRELAQFNVFQYTAVQNHRARLTSPRWSRSTAFCHLLIDFYFFVLLPLNCVRACGGLLRDEMQAGTLVFLTTRPLRRWQLVVAKYLSETAWLQIVMLLETVLLFAVGSFLHIPEVTALIPLFLAAQFLAVPAWSALGTFLGLCTKRYIALAMVYGLIVEMGIGRIPTNVNNLSLMRHLKNLLAHNDALLQLYDWPVSGLFVSVVALVMAGAIFLALSILLFNIREYHRAAEPLKG